jgi:hypothetical protein
LLQFVRRPEDCAIAGDTSEVDINIVIAGGTVMANLPQFARKLRRSFAAISPLVVS